MPSPSPERNLLFGLLALQNGFITRDQLVAAFGSWTADKRRGLDDILLEHAVLDAPKRDLLSALVNAHVDQHGGDAAQSLAKLSSIGPSARHDLERLNDGELSLCLSQLPPIDPDKPSDAFATMTHFVGQGTTGGRFVILRPHAAGGLGQVAVALDTELHREVALKEIRPEHADETSARTRFVREAEITGGLEHPGIVPVYGLGAYADGRPYYAMKFVKGRSLKTALEEFHQKHPHPTAGDYQGVEFRQLLQRFLDVCNAMQYAHDRGVLHRDLKPGNIMLGQYGETLVIDWGLAKPLGETEKDFAPTASGEKALIPQSSLSGSGAETQRGSAIGTPEYMSPEQAIGQLDDLGPATDVYSLGATLYHILTGRPPIVREKEEDDGALLQRVHRGTFPPPKTLQSVIPRVLDAICAKALSNKIAARYSLPRDLAADLEHWLADEPVTVVAETATDKLSRMGRKHRGVVTAVLAALVLIAVGSTIAAAMIDQQRQLNAKLASEKTKLADEKTELADEKSSLAESNAKLATTSSKNEALAIERADELEARTEELANQLYAAQIARANGELEAHDFLAAQQSLFGIPWNRRGWEYYYLWRKCMGTPLALRAASICFSPDGKWLAGLSYGSNLKLWDAETGDELRTFNGGPFSAACISFSPDGRRLACPTANQSVKVWDVFTGDELRTLSGQTGNVRSISFNPDSSVLAGGADDSSIILWDVLTGKEVQTLRGHTRGVGSVSFSPDGSRLASGAGDQTIRVWNTMTGDSILTLGGHATPVNSVCFSPDGSRLASGANDQKVRIWDTRTGDELQTLHGHTQSVTAVAFRPDGMVLASASHDETRLWDVHSGQEVRTLRPHLGYHSSITFSPDGMQLASASGGNLQVKLWDIERGEDHALLRLQQRQVVYSVSFSRDGSRLACACSDRTVKLWDVATGAEIQTLTAHADIVNSVSFSPDGMRLASASNDRTIKLWDATTGIELQTLRGHDHHVNSVSFSPDGIRLASASSDRTIKLWDVATGTELHTLASHSDIVTFVAFSLDGLRLASGSWDQTIKLWDASTASELLTLRGHTEHIFSVTFNPDGTRLASASQDGTVKLWDTESGIESKTLRGHTETPYSVCFSPDGMRLATSSSDRTIKIWNVLTGEELVTLRGHTSLVTSLAFSPDFATLASGSYDGTIRLWKIQMAEEIRTLRGHMQSIAFLGCNKAGTRIVSRDLGGNSLMWRIPEGEAVKNEPIPEESQLLTKLPQPTLKIFAPSTDIQLIRKNPNYNPWKEDAERRKKLSPKWHAEQAKAAEDSNNYYAAAFHLGRLPLSQLYDEPIKTRYDAALAKLKEQHITPPRWPGK